MRKLLRRDRRGANAVEFALIAPVLIAMLMGTMDYGWYFHQQTVLAGCVREAGRTGALTAQANDPVAAANARLVACAASYALPVPTGSFAALAGNNPDQLINVTVSLPFTRLTGLTPMPANIRASASMRMENQPPPPAPVP